MSWPMSITAVYPLYTWSGCNIPAKTTAVRLPDNQPVELPRKTALDWKPFAEACVDNDCPFAMQELVDEVKQVRLNVPVHHHILIIFHCHYLDPLHSFIVH